MRFLALLFFLAGAVRLPANGPPLPGNTITNEKGTTLQFNVKNQIFALERKADPSCRLSRIRFTEIVGQPQTSGRAMNWDEIWTVDHCGETMRYRIHFNFRGSVGAFQISGPFVQAKKQ